MEVIEDKKILREIAKKASFILVPTMGNLHSGHIELIKIAAKLKQNLLNSQDLQQANPQEKSPKILASIFVNPMQFGANEDLDKYPRTLKADLAKLEEAGCDYVFIPTVENIYPDGVENHTKIIVPNVSEGLCAISRPTHFAGVASIVAKLFLLSGANYAIFGEKDYQQLAVIRKMASDLEIPIQIIGAPIVRSETGLALSSRNGYLTAEELQEAPFLRKSLLQLQENLTKADIFGKNFNLAKIEQQIQTCADTFGARNKGWKIDYLELRNADLTPINADSKNLVLLAAIYLGTTRLLDNLSFNLDF